MFNPYYMPIEYHNELHQLNLQRQYHGGQHHHNGGMHHHNVGMHHHGGQHHHNGQHHHGGHGGHSGFNFNLGSLGSSLLGLGLGYLGGAGFANGAKPGGYGYGGFPGFGGFAGAPIQGFGPSLGGGLGYPQTSTLSYTGPGPNKNLYGQFQPKPGYNYSGYGSWSLEEYGLPSL
ncbi:hypothetical protein [Neobacillus drentensis]|uniref:hypothetical protein n=1 Tax=Neobacillus drentensis TaxID=220684 RepID=UPI0030020ECA